MDLCIWCLARKEGCGVDYLFIVHLYLYTKTLELDRARLQRFTECRDTCQRIINGNGLAWQSFNALEYLFGHVYTKGNADRS